MARAGKLGSPLLRTEAQPLVFSSSEGSLSPFPGQGRGPHVAIATADIGEYSALLSFAGSQGKGDGQEVDSGCWASCQAGHTPEGVGNVTSLSLSWLICKMGREPLDQPAHRHWSQQSVALRTNGSLEQEGGKKKQKAFMPIASNGIWPLSCPPCPPGAPQPISFAIQPRISSLLSFDSIGLACPVGGAPYGWTPRPPLLSTDSTLCAKELLPRQSESENTH